MPSRTPGASDGAGRLTPDHAQGGHDMANLQIRQRQRKGRTFITIAATPKSMKTRALLQLFKKGIRGLEKKWRVAAKAAKKK